MMQKVRLWIAATRPWSFLMTLASTLLGLILAVQSKSYELDYIIPVICGLIPVHAASNMLNDLFDVKYGFDTVESLRFRQHPIASGVIKESMLKKAILALYGIGVIIAAYLTSVRGALIAIFAGVGLILSIIYNVRPLRLKEKPLGELVVFAIWGPLIVSGTYYTLTGYLASGAILASVPVGLLVSAVLLANNIRDIENDSKKGAKTLAIIMGYTAASMLYASLLSFTYFLLILLIFFEILSPTSLVSLLTLPKGISLIRLLRNKSPEEVDIKTAKLTLSFTLLVIIGESLNLVSQAIRAS